MTAILCYTCGKEEQEHYFDLRRCELYGDGKRFYNIRREPEEDVTAQEREAVERAVWLEAAKVVSEMGCECCGAAPVECAYCQIGQELRARAKEKSK